MVINSSIVNNYSKGGYKMKCAKCNNEIKANKAEKKVKFKGARFCLNCIYLVMYEESDQGTKRKIDETWRKIDNVENKIEKIELNNKGVEELEELYKELEKLEKQYYDLFFENENVEIL